MRTKSDTFFVFFSKKDEKVTGYDSNVSVKNEYIPPSA